MLAHEHEGERGPDHPLVGRGGVAQLSQNAAVGRHIERVRRQDLPAGAQGVRKRRVPGLHGSQVPAEQILIGAEGADLLPVESVHKLGGVGPHGVEQRVGDHANPGRAPDEGDEIFLAQPQRAVLGQVLAHRVVQQGGIGKGGPARRGE